MLKHVLNNVLDLELDSFDGEYAPLLCQGGANEMLDSLAEYLAWAPRPTPPATLRRTL